MKTTGRVEAGLVRSVLCGGCSVRAESRGAVVSLARESARLRLGAHAMVALQRWVANDNGR